MASIAITGCGIICSIGDDCASVLDSLKGVKSGIASPRILSTTHSELPVGEVPHTDTELKAMLGIADDCVISRTSLLGAIAVNEALASAKIDTAKIGGKRVALISGTTVGGMDVTERFFDKMLDDSQFARLLSHHHCGANTDEIAAICNIGECYRSTISTACSSALNAIIQGARMLLNGEADIVIAGGAEALTRFHLLGFNSLKILDSNPCAPFDANRQGLNLGEGAGYLVLERTDDAIARGTKPLAYVAGYGNRCDAHHQTATSENGEGAYLAMADALALSGADLRDIDYVNAHGTGTPDNDRSESAALRRIFGDAIPPVSSTKSLTGHTTSASGGIESVICLLAMEHGFIPVGGNWNTPDADCIQPVTEPRSAVLHNVLCNSFGFGGNDSAVIFSDTPVGLDSAHDMDITVLGRAEIETEDDLVELSKYVGPMERRRMSSLLKAATLTSLKALQDAGVDVPDAIVIATQYGMLEQGEKILDYISANGEDGLSPTLFMQSTHNTIAGALAIRLKCHGWNVTYSQGADSLAHALAEAKRLIAEGRASTVLVGHHDYCPDGFMRRLELAGEKIERRLVSKSIVIGKR